MTKQTVSVIALVCLLFLACQNNYKNNKAKNKSTIATETHSESKTTNIPFTLAKNYFVNNTVEKLDNPKIETAEKFNEIFGMATTMAKDGKPTEIDFQKQYVIAVILPETDQMTSVDPVSLQKDEKGKITLTYKTISKQKQSYSIRPFFAAIVDKKENGNIELKVQK